MIKHQYPFTPLSIPGCVLYLPTDHAILTREAGMAGQFTAATSEYLSIADNALLSVGDNILDIFGWVYLDTTPASSAQMGILGKWASGDLEYVLLVDNTGGTIRFQFLTRNTADDTTTTVTASTFGAPSISTWYAIHIYHDPTGNVIGIAVNDGVADTQAMTGGVRDGTAAFEIGRHTAGSYINGRAQCVGFWKGATLLTAAQLTQLYNSGIPLAYEALDPSLRTGLISYWELNEPSGTRTDMVTSNANDLTDNNTVTTNPGTVLNAVGSVRDLSGRGNTVSQTTQSLKPVIRKNGITDRDCLSFDGADDYINRADSDLFTFASVPFTVSAWINPSISPDDYDSIIGKWNNAAAATKEWLLRFGVADVIEFRLIDTAGTPANIGRTTTDTISVGQWTQIVGTYDGSTTPAGIAIYFNGVRKDTTNIGTSFTGMSNTTAKLFIGAEETATADNFFTGKMDEFCIYNRVLNQAEIIKLYTYGRRKFG